MWWGGSTVTGTPIGAWGLLANLPDDRALANVVGTGQAGDLLEANAANQLVVNAAVLPHQAAGRLMQGKIGAAVQLVLVGSVD